MKNLCATFALVSLVFAATAARASGPTTTGALATPAQTDRTGVANAAAAEDVPIQHAADRMVCRVVTATGSKLGKRSCRSTAQIEHDREMARTQLARAVTCQAAADGQCR